MIKIQDLDEAKLMNTILHEMLLGKTVFNMIPHKIGIDFKYFTSLIERIVDYSDNYKSIIRYSNTEDYYNFRSIHETKDFLDIGGFENVFEESKRESKLQENMASLEERNLELQNRSLEYEETIRQQNQTIRDLEETHLRLSIFQKYWWAFTTIGAILGWLIKTFVFKIN